MRIFNNNVLPLKIPKKNTDSEIINIYNYRNIFYNGEINISSMDIDNTSSAIFVENKPINIGDIIIQSGKLLLIDNDIIISSDVVIQNGGELRVL